MTAQPTTRYKFTPEQRAKAIVRSVATRQAKAQSRRAELKAVRVLTHVKSAKPSTQAASTVARELETNGARAKALLSVEAVNQAVKANNAEPGVFKTLVDACDKLFGWSRNDGPSCLVQNNYLGDLTPGPVAPQPVVSCGVSVTEAVS